MRAPGGTLWGYPKGVFLLSFTELWERFSYFGMLALLVLFLTSSVADGGFGWSRQEALKLYGIYTGLVFSGPLLGGWIANHWWGERRCILVGGLLLILGQACLTAPALVPKIAGELTGIDVRPVWLAAGVTLGHLWPGADVSASLYDSAARLGSPADLVIRTYRWVAHTFGAGLMLIICGTALIKPTISSIIGRFFDERDPRRDGAFALFFTGIYVGAISATFIAGYLGERVAWHWGFSAAGFGMTCGLLVYLWKQQVYLADIGMRPVRLSKGDGPHRMSREQRDRIHAILLQGVFTVAYAAAFYQKGGLLTLYAREHLDRMVGGWEIPVTWLLVISTGTFILVTPLFSRLWQWCSAHGRDPPASTKLAWGLLALGVGYLLIAWATGSSDGKSAWYWLAFTYVCFGIGDALVWPIQISMVSRLAPAHLSAVFVGGWYITIGLGSWLTGYVGALGYSWGMLQTFLLIAAATIGLGCLLWAVAPRIRRLAHGLA